MDNKLVGLKDEIRKAIKDSADGLNSRTDMVSGNVEDMTQAVYQAVLTQIQYALEVKLW